jgi:hypothetical protein
MPPPDDFDKNLSGLSSPLRRFVAISASDESDLPFCSRGVCLGVAGTVRFNPKDSLVPVTVNLAAGIFHWIRADKIYVTGTSASGIVIAD